MSVWDKVDYKVFEEHKQEVQARNSEIDSRFSALDKKIAEKTPDLVEDVRVAAERAATEEKRIRSLGADAEAGLKVLSQERGELQALLQLLKTEVSETKNLNTTLRNSVNENQKLAAELAGSKVAVQTNVAEVAASSEKAKALLRESESVPTQVEAAQKLLKDCEVLRENIKGLVDHSITRKTEIDEVYNEVFGQDVKDSDGRVERVEGLRDKLKKSFEGVDGTLKTFVDAGKKDVGAVTDQLKALMPGGMAAGLSAAYEAKARDEIATQASLEITFKRAIGGLILISLIPFAIDTTLLLNGKELLEVFRETPVLPILPLYFPVLWLALSTSKKVKLSKRLIEEYTHKSVVGKTFSGLSEQIETLPQGSEVQHDLRTRLLYNVLQVSAENPGKLITDYRKSDHPLMEALTGWFTKRQASSQSKQANKVDAGLAIEATVNPLQASNQG